MAPEAKLLEALVVFRELGWASATPEQAPGLPLGTAEQRRIAKEGLRSGEWGEAVVGANGFEGFSWYAGDRAAHEMLGLFALAVGVDARRAVRVLICGDRGVVFDLVVARGTRFAASFVKAAVRGASRDGAFFQRYGGVAVRLVVELGLERPEGPDYLATWAREASRALVARAPVLEAAPRGGSQALPEGLVLKDAPALLRETIQAQPERQFSLWELVVEFAARGVIAREEAIDLAILGLDAAQRPRDRRAWALALTAQGVKRGSGEGDAGPGLAAGGAELLPYLDRLVPLLGLGDGIVVEALGVPLLEASDDEGLPDLALTVLTAPTKKARRVVLKALAARPRPSEETLQDVLPSLEGLLGLDEATTRGVRAVLAAWGSEATVQEGAGGSDGTGSLPSGSLGVASIPVSEGPWASRGSVNALTCECWPVRSSSLLMSPDTRGVDCGRDQRRGAASPPPRSSTPEQSTTTCHRRRPRRWAVGTCTRRVRSRSASTP